MKPGAFAYRRAHCVDEALELLAEHGEDAKVLAGGQSLLPMMNYRLARPAVLVDIGPVAELDYVVRDSDGTLRVGARTTHAELERGVPDALAGGFELISEVAAEIGHPPIRSLGTIGGSLAHADPAAEWCTAALVLDASVLVRSVSGTRTLAAADFFHGFLTTALEPTELITQVAFPLPCVNTGFAEYSYRRGDFAVASVGVAVHMAESICSSARVVVGGVEARPARMPAAERALVGTSCEATAIEQAAEQAATAVEPVDRTPGMVAFRRHLTRTLTIRALTEAMAR